MKRYVTKLALLLLLLTLLIPSSLPTATAAPSNDTEEEYHPGVGAKELKIYQKAVMTVDCGDLPPVACTPNGPNDPEDQEKLIHKRILPGGTIIEEEPLTHNPPTKHWQYEVCGYPSEQLRETNYDQVNLYLGYPPEYKLSPPHTIKGYNQGLIHRYTVTEPHVFPPYHNPDCEKALPPGTYIDEVTSSGRYTLTDAPDSDEDDVDDPYDACPFNQGPASNDGCPECTARTAELANMILDLRLPQQQPGQAEYRVIFDPVHTSGNRDEATAYHNIQDTANGERARTSSYHHYTPSGQLLGGGQYWGGDARICLTSQMLTALYQIGSAYSLRVTELAGGAHSNGSFHYRDNLGRAFDINRINGYHYHNDREQWIELANEVGELCETLAESMGVQVEALYPATEPSNHMGHVHCAFY